MESGFGCVNADIRTFVDHFRDVDEVIEFEFGAISSWKSNRQFLRQPAAGAT
jgi:hypothetical protein